jgi:thioesterase domain-containing protein
MAADYLQRLRAVQPHGPYRLLGYSFGGNVAHAMASRLATAGDRVSLLVLMDAYPPEALGPRAPDTDRDHLLDTIRQQAGGLPEPALAAVLDTHAHCLALRDAHTTGHYPGDAVLFTSSTPGSPGAAGWRPHIGGTIAAHEVDAPHEQLLHDTALDTIGPVLLDALRLSDLGSSDRGSSDQGSSDWGSSDRAWAGTGPLPDPPEV